MKKLLPLVLVLSGCVHMSKSVRADRSDQPVPSEDVEVLLGGEAVPESCVYVADLHAEASQELASEKKVLGKFRREAGKLGANVVRVQAAYSGSRNSSSMFASRESDEFEGQAYWCPQGAVGSR
jgi:predicted trehalose synthase